METFKRFFTNTDVQIFCAVLIAIGLVIAGFLKSLDSAEWASWVQAVGAIVAILGAYRIANSQHQRQVEAEGRNATADEKRKLEITKVFLDQISDLARMLKEEVSGPQAGARSRPTLEYLGCQIRALQQLPMLEMPDALLVSKIVTLVQVAQEFDRCMQPYLDNTALETLADARRERLTKEAVRLFLVSGEAYDRCEIALGLRR